MIGRHEPDPAIPVTEVPAAAIAAFLRGVERRGALFAELQCGDADTGDAALAGALRAFRNLAAGLPMAEWPSRFWSLLAASPQLRQDAPLAQWPPSLRALAGVAPRPRAALLLRLAAGLDEATAATVLGLDEAGYRQALADACPRDPAGQPDAAAWRALAEDIQRQLRELPPLRLARLARLREEALAAARGPQAQPSPQAQPQLHVAPAFARGPVREPGSRWRWRVLPFAAVCAVAALAAWRWWPQIRSLSAPVPPPSPIAESTPNGVFALADLPAVASEELPAAEAPAMRADPVPVLAADVAPLDETEEAIVRQADFLAWFVAVAEATAQAVSPGMPQPAVDGGSGVVERLPSPAVPRELRAQRAAWDSLDEGERVRLRDSALRFAMLPMAQRQQLHAQFDALDGMEKRGWRLGPTLGAHYPRLHALLAYVPADEAAALPAALRSMDPVQREALAALVQRTPPQEIDALRRELLSAAPAQRETWLRRLSAE